MTKEEYEKTFLDKKKKKRLKRVGLTIRPELKNKLRQIAAMAGINMLSIGYLLDNIIEHHVNTYNAPLKELFEENTKLFE